MAALTVAMDGGAGEAKPKPGDDFFAYANSEWLASTIIPPGKPRWGARNEIAERTAQQLATVIREAGMGSSPTARKVADFHAACLDESSIEKKGLAPIKPLLESVEQLRGKSALARWLGEHMRADVDPLRLGVYESSQVFGLAVSFGIHGEPDNIAYLVQGGLGLGDREAYLDEAPAKQAMRARYRDHIAQMLTAAGFDNAAQRAEAVLALETELARSHADATESGNDVNADHHWSQADFTMQAPGMDWRAFFGGAGLARWADIVAWQPRAVTGTAALVASRPLPVWKDYLRFHIIDRYAEVLPRAIAEPTAAHRALFSGSSASVPRGERAVAATNQALPEAVGRLYVERYFPAPAKARAKAILDHVVASFGRRVAAVSWMGPTTKRVAAAKLEGMYFGVGYPAQWQDDSKLVIDPHDATGNLRRIDEWNYRNALAKLGKPVDRREWSITPQTPGAILNFQLDSYNFAAALLQPPKFDPAASDAMNYGAIGAIFAHEVSHFVDTLGADYDASGAAKRWWTAEDRARYDAAVQPLVEQFAAYRPFPAVAVDGKLTLVENLADLGGLAAAFDAYREAVGSRASGPDELRRMDREFFIGFARSWRAKATDDAVRAQVKSDGHAPESYRIATVRNLDAWYEAFDVRPGQRLYVEPGARVKVW